MNCLLHLHAKHPVQQRGVASIEFALILPLMLLILFAMLLFGRIFWTYNVLHKATHDAARYMVSIPAAEFANSLKFFTAKQTAQNMVVSAASDLNLSLIADNVGLQCDNAYCFYNSGNSLPNAITVTVSANITDDAFYYFTGVFFPSNLNFITVTSASTMRFVN